MKAEERHELRENDLANWLQYGLWAFLKANGSYLLLIVALGFLGYQLWGVYQRRQVEAQQRAWASLNEATSSENPFKTLDELITSSTVKPVQAQACLKLGQLYGKLAAFPEELVKRNMTRAEALSRAYEFHAKALTFQGDDALIAAKAHLGIAGVYEDREDWDKAKAEYQAMVDNKQFAGDLANLAKDKLTTLDDRRHAPRLAAMIPPPQPVRPDPMAGLGGLGFPGGLGSGLGGGTGGGLPGPTTSSAFGPLLLPGGIGTGGAGGGTTTNRAPALPYGPLPAYTAPSIPGISPAETAPGATAPATEPK
jgi:predicted negative regulator of RcsB-dependent stress response